MDIDDKLGFLKSANEEKFNSITFKRLSSLFDSDGFIEIDSFTKSDNNYAQVVAGFGYVDGLPVYAFAQNSDIDGGAMSKAHAEKICKVYQLAAGNGYPVVGIYDSIGGRLEEENELLKAYGDILLKANNLSGVVPQVSVIAGPCIGASAVIASSADVLIMTKGSDLNLNANGDDTFDNSVTEPGIAHIVCKNEFDSISKARDIINRLPSNNLDEAVNTEFRYNPDLGQRLNEISREIIDSSDDGLSKEIIECISDKDSFIEFQSKFGLGFRVGLTRTCGCSVGILSSNGAMDSDSCSKAARFVRFCDAFSIPLVTFVNSSGFNSLKGALKISGAYSEATTAKIAIITGEAYGPVYLALAGSASGSDVVFGWPGASISALEPKTAAVFLNSYKLKGSSDAIKDRKNLIKEYRENEASSFKAAAYGFVQDVIYPHETRQKIVKALDMLKGKRISTLSKKHSNIQL